MKTNSITLVPDPPKFVLMGAGLHLCIFARAASRRRAIHLIDEGIDAGAILLQERRDIPVEPAGTQGPDAGR